MSDLFEKAIVQKRNMLNELRANNLTLQELRFFTIYLSKINPYDKSTRTVKFSLSEYQKIMEFSRLNIKRLQESAKSLLSKTVILPTERGGFDAFQLFKEFKIDKDESGAWYVLIDAHDKALPLMFDFKDRYFKYELWNALQLHSVVQIRMYEILKQYETIGKREVSIDELRQLLGIPPDKYKRWERFRTQILDTCQQILSDKTDISYTYVRGKVGNGGKWLSVIFTIKKNTQYTRQLMLDEFFSYTTNYTEEQVKAAIEEPEPEKSIEPDSELGDLGFYSSACGDEFTTAQMESIIQIVNQMQLPPHEYGASIAKYHFLLEHYTRFKAMAESTDIKNRYSYFYAMIKAERDKQQGGEDA